MVQQIEKLQTLTKLLCMYFSGFEGQDSCILPSWQADESVRAAQAGSSSVDSSTYRQGLLVSVGALHCRQVRRPWKQRLHRLRLADSGVLKACRLS